MNIQKPLNTWEGITLNITGEVPEKKFIVKENAGLQEAWDIARQCRVTHPDEEIEILPRESPDGLVFTVYRVVREAGK